MSYKQLNTTGDIIYFIGAFFYLLVNFRDAGFFESFGIFRWLYQHTLRGCRYSSKKKMLSLSTKTSDSIYIPSPNSQVTAVDNNSVVVVST